MSPALSMISPQKTYDVTVIGAGPVGCVTALEHAQKGASVLLVEAKTAPSSRLAGEWLHPTAMNLVEKLQPSFQKSFADYPCGRGFVVFPDDGSEPILLDYPDHQQGRSIEHNQLVQTLWNVVEETQGIDFQTNVFVSSTSSNAVEMEDRNQLKTSRILSQRIVGADGRNSNVRKTLLAQSEEHQLLYYSAGILLEKAVLPFEGYGHILLGGLGPVLMYRISPETIRVCIDVPSLYVKVPNKASFLWDAYQLVIPVELKEAFFRALQTHKIQWAANHFRHRNFFGKAEMALVGDAVGHFHPLTAAGMTLGFLDAHRLSHSKNVEEYERSRKNESRVPQILATALYEVLSGHDDETVAVRQGVFQLWRENPEERKRTMRLLSSGDTELSSFSMAFLKVLGKASLKIITGETRSTQMTHKAQVFGQMFHRLGWLSQEILPTLWGSSLPSVHSFLQKSQETPMNQKAQKASLHSVAEGSSVKEDIQTAVQHLLSLQKENGSWEGEVEWCSLLGAQYILTMTLLGKTIEPAQKEAFLQDFRLHQLESGAWGLHACSEGYLFTTCLVYTSCRFLGISKEDPLLQKAQRWIQQEGSALLIPSWGKFWLAMLGLYSWEGVQPLLPQIWQLPASNPLHPSKWYCHTRLIYASMSFLYTKRFTMPITPLHSELRKELFSQPWEEIPFARSSKNIRKEEMIAPPSMVLNAWYKVSSFLESQIPQTITMDSFDKIEEIVLQDLQHTSFRSISPVSGFLNLLVLSSTSSRHANERDKALQEIDFWLWKDEKGLRVAGAKSDVWDTSFAIQALEASDLEHSKTTQQAIVRAKAFLQDQQIKQNFSASDSLYRHNPRGGWGFCSSWHQWPVSDCTAEALVALLEKKSSQEPVQRLIAMDAVQFLLGCQNKDGGFGSYEKQQTPFSIEWLNPSEMFGNATTEHSYVECTASSLKALSLFQRHFPNYLAKEVQQATQQAMIWLRKQQQPSGEWKGNWGVYCIYGTFFAVEGLLAIGTSPGDPSIWKACHWLVENQNADGGWAENARGSLEKKYIPRNKSEPTQTAWALLTLLQSHFPKWDAIEKGIRFLLQNRSKDGKWEQTEPSGVFFQSALLDYKLYQVYFPLKALQLYEQRRKNREKLIHSPQPMISSARESLPFQLTTAK